MINKHYYNNSVIFPPRIQFLGKDLRNKCSFPPFFHSAKSRERKWVFAPVAVRNTKVIIPIVPTEFSSLLFCKLGYCCIHFISTAKTTTKNFLEFLVPLSMRHFSRSRSCSENKLVVLFNRSPREALSNSLVTVEPSRNGRKQEVASDSQLSSSRAQQFSFILAALLFFRCVSPCDRPLATPTCRGPDGLSSPPKRELPVPYVAAGRPAVEKPGPSASQ